MKYGIITLVSDNYGNKYQNYAVEQLLSQYGEVTTFGLENLYKAPAAGDMPVIRKLRLSYIAEVLRARMMYTYDYNDTSRSLLQSLWYVFWNRNELRLLREQRGKRFYAFAKEHLHIDDCRLNFDNTSQKEWLDTFDYFICGSDQIWNPTYPTTSGLAFCSFAPNKAVALAPSFGVSEIPEYRKEEYARWLGAIKGLSIRENAGKKLIKDLCGREAQVLLDPTMALSATRWADLAKAPEMKLPKHYVLCYFLGKVDKAYKKKIHSFAREKGLPVITLFDITQPVYYLFDPAEVLYALKHADYVLTDSFHGSVFSILFEKQFFVLDRNEGGTSMSSRINTLLDRFELQSRYCIAPNYSTDISQEQWERIRSILEAERESTKTYLEQAIGVV